MARQKPDPKYTYHIVTLSHDGTRVEHNFENADDAARERIFLRNKQRPKTNSLYKFVGPITKKPRKK